jgi:hypothetical protein
MGSKNTLFSDYLSLINKYKSKAMYKKFYTILIVRFLIKKRDFDAAVPFNCGIGFAFYGEKMVEFPCWDDSPSAAYDGDGVAAVPKLVLAKGEDSFSAGNPAPTIVV